MSINVLDYIIGDVSDVHDIAMYPLGSTHFQPAQNSGLPVGAQDTGPRLWVYVGNGSGALINKGQALIKDTGASGNPEFVCKPAPVSSASAVVIGVAQHAFADGKYTFVQREGRGEVLASEAAGCSADTALRVSTTAGELGQVIDAAATFPAIGVSVGAAAPASGGTLVFANLNCPGR